MIAILHAEDDKYWLDDLFARKEALSKALGDQVEILSRDSIAAAGSVLDGTDVQMRKLQAEADKKGQKKENPDVLILDLMMEGGRGEEVVKWFEGVSLFGRGLTQKDVDEIGKMCPALKLGRDAAAGGAIVVILTQFPWLVGEDHEPGKPASNLLMEACGASKCLFKKPGGDWPKKLEDFLVSALV